MTSDKKTAALLADLFVKKGLQYIVISPGSRNAPLIIAFTNHADIKAISVVDERSAAFFALGIAQSTGKTVAVACTSGSAPLNYAPAIAEAYYQKIPLLVLTADRPPSMIDIGDGQAIRQKNVFSNYVKSSKQLPLEVKGHGEYISVNKLINESIDETLFPEPGPVHLNIPFDEPLYQTVETGMEGTLLDTRRTPKQDYKWKEKFKKLWFKSNKVMLLVGQGFFSANVNYLLESLSHFPQVTILSETTSNLNSVSFIDCIDNVLTVIEGEALENVSPELLITFGNAVVSKKIKKFLRENPPENHWHISPSGEYRDTYFALSKVVNLSIDEFLENIQDIIIEVNSSYAEVWKNIKQKSIVRRESFIETTQFSDLKVFKLLLDKIPSGTNLHLANSTPVRYSQLFGNKSGIKYFSNRGVSGIDGSLSTASGFAYSDDSLNLIITGDLSFFYDSNALMNQNLTSNFKIIVLNNSGGGIFRFIPGPDSTAALEQYFEARHSLKANKLAEAYNINYFKAENEVELHDVFSKFISKMERPALLEIITPGEENGQILRDYFSFLKNASH